MYYIFLYGYHPTRLRRILPLIGVYLSVNIARSLENNNRANAKGYITLLFKQILPIYFEITEFRLEKILYFKTRINKFFRKQIDFLSSRVLIENAIIFEDDLFKFTEFFYLLALIFLSKEKQIKSDKGFLHVDLGLLFYYHSKLIEKLQKYKGKRLLNDISN